MKVKTAKNKERLSQEILDWFSKKKKSKWFYLLLILGMLGILTASHVYSIYYGATLQAEGNIHYVKRWGQTLGNKPFSIVSNFFEGAAAPAKKMQIDIKFENYQKIAFQRELALKYGPAYRNHPSNMGYVPAKVNYEGEESKVKIRLKGGQIEHFGHPFKWSFKLKMKGDGRVEGMKSFSIQQAKNRSYLNEWILHRLLKHNGLIGLQYEFVELIVNGKNHGIYALEENMAKQLLESNEMKEGPIINYSSDINWDLTAGQALQFYGGEVHFYNDDLLENPTLKKNFLTAKNLLEAFRKGELPTSKVFDSKKMAKYFAIIDLTGYHHGTSLKDMKLYYNPITSLIEPIGYDNGYFLPYPQPSQKLMGEGKTIAEDNTIDAVRIGGKSDWHRVLFADKAFYETYLAALEEVSKKEYLDDFFEAIKEDFEKNRSIIRKDQPWYNHDGAFENPQTLYKNQRYIQRILNPGKVVQAHFKSEELKENLSLEIGNIISMPLEVLGVSFFNDSIDVKLEQPFLLHPYGGKIVDYQSLQIPLNGKIVWADSILETAKLKLRIPGASQILVEPTIHPWSYESSGFVESNFMTQDPNFKSFDFLNIDEAAKTVSFKVGKTTISQNVIIPSGYQVIMSPGSSIDLINKASILTHSPVSFIGNENAPIQINSSDKTGQGMMVVRAEEKSNLDYVLFENLSNPNKAGWSITGAVSFYESPVSIKNTSFINNIVGDDFLNIIRTNFTIEDSYFYKINSDAFDGDFCTGTVKNTRFNVLGNDGIDVSGSRINIINVELDSVFDKALSAGENSHLIVSNVKINNSELGVTSKDLSSVKINGIQIDNTKIPYVLFEKKPEFGPATITATNSKIKSYEIPYLVESTSTMTVDGKKQFSEESSNIKDLLYGVKFGKKSIR